MATSTVKDPFIEELKKKKECEVNVEIDTVLTVFGIYHWRNNSGSYKTENSFVRFGKKGSSDWLGICNDGRFLAVEAKRPVKGRTTKLQSDFIDEINRRGGVGIIARSGEELREQLKIRGVIR